MRTGISSLDFRLGLRMLVRYPGLTLVGGLAIAFAIWVGAGAFEFIGQVLHPRLPLEGGERIVGITTVDRATARAEVPSLHDWARWKEELRTVEELGAFRLVERNLVAADGGGEPVEVAEVDAAAFRVARGRPLLGRPLVAADEEPGAAPVAVLGHDTWLRRFGGDPDVVGREIRLGRSVHTVVGVMPEGYGFPVDQGLWVPLRLDPLAFAPGEAPRVRVFGRLAPGATLDEARAELAAAGERASAASPATHGRLRPRVQPYANSILDFSREEAAGTLAANLFLVMLLVLVCGNVALLMFARAASREGELVVRSALGATRRRIVGQLFAEALVLAAVGAAVGLAAVEPGLAWALRAVRGSADFFPFWLRPALSPATVAYAAGLTLLAALVAGGIPGLKVTRGLRAGLQRASAGGGGFRFGGIWTAVIVVQIAVTVAFPVAAYIFHLEVAALRTEDAGFPDEQYLAARVEMDALAPGGAPLDPDGEPFRARYAAAVQRLEERLAAEPGVESVAFGETLPRQYHASRWIEVEGMAAASASPEETVHRVTTASVARDFFDAFGAPVLAGRGFHSGDLHSGARAVVVSESFVRTVLGGRGAVGQRIRDVENMDGTGARSPWFEIVGVVGDVGIPQGEYDGKVAGLYYPVVPGGAYPGHLAVRVKGDPAAFAPRLRAVALAMDPDLRLYEMRSLDRVNAGELDFWAFWVVLLAAVSGVAMFLSLAGIYAVMAFTAAQRTREIGIRVALGGTADRIVRAIFRRPLAQLGLGIVLGATVSTALVGLGERTAISAGSLAALAVYAAAMAGICLLACIVPTRRALAVEPTEALKAEA